MNAIFAQPARNSERIDATAADSALHHDANVGSAPGALLEYFENSDAAGAAAVISLPQCTLHYMTEAAREILAGSNPLFIDGGALSATTSRGRSQLGRAVDAALERGARTMIVIRDGQNSIGMWITPLSERVVSGLSASSKYAVVDLMTEDETLSVEEFAPVAEGFDLTEAEAEVARLLVIGFDLAEIAAVRSVKRTTVRNQCKTVLTKLGCRRQIELMRLLTTLTRRAPSVFQIGVGNRGL